MANIDGGALSFKSILENDQMNSAIEETLRRIQGLSDATVAGGKQMDKAFFSTSEAIQDALVQVNHACEVHEAKLGELTGQYVQLGQEASEALVAGREAEARAIQEAQARIQGEIVARQQALEEAKELSAEIEREIQQREEHTEAVEKNKNAQMSLRGRIRELREEMALLIEQGIDEQSDAYKALVNELGRLQDIQGDIAAQGNILANDEAKFQGFIQGISGLSGAFSAATGAISLFAGENENLQRIMTKVQSVMAIAMGMQQVAQTLNKDSAFRLVTLNGLKEWWAGIVAKATIAENAETVATIANTTAQEAQASATAQNTAAQSANTAATATQATVATAGATANWTLAGAFRAVGIAIRSIPVFGWILAGVSALVAIVGSLSNKASEAKEKAEKLNKAIVDLASAPVASLIKLQAEWASLGDNMQAKQRFIEQNKKAFEDLGLVLNDVYDAEKRLMSSEHTKQFIAAQLAKAQGKALLESEEYKELLTQTTDIKSKIVQAKERKGKILDTKSPHGSTLAYNEDVKIRELEKELKPYEEALINMTQRSIKITQEGQSKMDTLNRESLQRNAKTVAGKKALLEQELADLQSQRGRIDASNTKAIAQKDKEINAKRAQLERLEAQGGKVSSSSAEKDPFVAKLEKKKEAYAQYAKWKNSTSEDIRKASKTEFAELIKSGNSYKEYLTRLQEQISREPQNNQTRKQLSAIRSELAELEGKTVLEAFNESLKRELDGATSVLQRLEIISQKRKELADDGTDIDGQKKKTLDEAEQSATDKQREETQKLLDDYASYLDRKIKLDTKYSNDLALLERARAQAATEEERKKIDAAIANRKLQHQKDSRLSGDPEYDQMLQTYRSFEQKKEAIIEEYAEKRKKAQEHGNAEMLAQLDKAQNEALSKLAIDELKVSPDWEKVFGNLDEISTRELERLLATIDGKTAVLGIELSPEDFKVVQDKVKELKNAIKKRNPFKALSDGFRDLKKATSDEDNMSALATMFDSASRAGEQLKGIISDVTDTLGILGVEGTEEVGHVIQAIDGLASGVKDIISGNPVQMVGGAIKAIGSVVNYFAGANDRRAERSIKAHQQNVANLTSTYKELEWQISRSLSSSLYKHQQASIDNMRQQQAELRSMIRAENDKKKTDGGKIDGWEEQIKELDRSIEGTIDGMRKSLLDTDVKSIASQLGDAIVGAFENGKDAAVAWGDTVKKIVNNLVKNLLIQKVLQKPIDRVISKYTSKWVDDSGAFKGFDVVIGDLDSLSVELGGMYPQLEQALNALKEKLNLSAIEADTSLTGAVKGVSEETASIVAGQLNAMRINQTEVTNVLRQQLAALSVISQNTSYNRFLVDIHKELKAIKSSSSDPLRAKGLV